MKTSAQILLVIFFLVSFFAGLLAATFKFQVLNYNFWTSAYNKHNVYQNLAEASKTSFESQINKEGGNKNDVKILTDLITKDNAKDVVNRNLANLLSFMNGKSSQINVYLPIDKVPTNLLPKNLSKIKTEMTLPELLTIFNFQDWNNLPLQNLSNTGYFADILLVSTLSILLLIMVLLFFLVERGARFISVGVAFAISGCLTFFLVSIGTSLNTALTKDLLDKSNISTVVAGIVFPPVVSEIVAVWQILGFILLIVGVGLFFVKKPS